MKRLIISILLMIVSLSIFAQRDSTIVRELTFTTDSTIITDDTLKVWSNSLGEYVNYSRIDMGYRMNTSIEYSEKANRRFWTGISLVGVGGAMYTVAAYSNPVIYVEGHQYYTEDYFNQSKRNRNLLVGVGTGVLCVGAYFLWDAHTLNRKARWTISPNGLKYSF